MPDTGESTSQYDTNVDGNVLWEHLPAAVFSDIMARLEHSELICMSITCWRWRDIVQGSITRLAPKSVLVRSATCLTWMCPLVDAVYKLVARVLCCTKGCPADLY